MWGAKDILQEQDEKKIMYTELDKIWSVFVPTNAPQFYFINKVPLHVLGTYVPIFRRTDYTYTATGSTSSLYV